MVDRLKTTEPVSQGARSVRFEPDTKDRFCMRQTSGGHSVLRFGSVRFGSSVFEEIRFLENRNRSVPRNFRNRVFRFSVISVRFRF